jgi:hypothetical protein
MLFLGQEMVKALHTVWIKIDESLPWIELKGSYETRKDAKEAAKNYLHRTQVKIVAIPERTKELKAMAIIRR